MDGGVPAGRSYGRRGQRHDQGEREGALGAGTEGDGVADVLFGTYAPTGKLSFSWPRASSTTLRQGDPGYQKLFEFGYGLSYPSAG